MYKLVFPEVVGGVLDELNEGDEKPPRMRPVNYQSLQQDSAKEEELLQQLQLQFECLASFLDPYS